MLLAGALYYTYRLADGVGLSEKEATGKVVGKEHVPFSEKYQMQNVGGVNRTVKIAVPETWLLTVDLGGTQAQASVPQEDFQSLMPGAEVRVKYKKRRVSGVLQVTEYLGRAGG